MHIFCCEDIDINPELKCCGTCHYDDQEDGFDILLSENLTLNVCCKVHEDIERNLEKYKDILEKLKTQLTYEDIL